jgi:hypothetical protein
LDLNKVIVTRRCNDGWVNATQVLKALSIEKSMRQRILKEFPEGQKVQGGCANYQGVWVPVEKGLDLHKKYKKYEYEEKLQSLLTDHRCAGNVKPKPTRFARDNTNVDIQLGKSLFEAAAAAPGSDSSEDEVMELD